MGAPSEQTITQKTELDPVLQAHLYGGNVPASAMSGIRPAYLQEGGSLAAQAGNVGSLYQGEQKFARGGWARAQRGRAPGQGFGGFQSRVPAQGFGGFQGRATGGIGGFAAPRSVMPMVASPMSGMTSPMPMVASPMSGMTSPMPGATSTMPTATSPMPGATSTMPTATSPMPGATSTMPTATSPMPGATSTMPTAASPMPGATSTMPMAATGFAVGGAVAAQPGGAGSFLQPPTNADGIMSAMPTVSGPPPSPTGGPAPTTLPTGGTTPMAGMPTVSGPPPTPTGGPAPTTLPTGGTTPMAGTAPISSPVASPFSDPKDQGIGNDGGENGGLGDSGGGDDEVDTSGGPVLSLAEQAYQLGAGVDLGSMLPEYMIAGRDPAQQGAYNLALQGVGSWSPYLQQGYGSTMGGVGAMYQGLGATQAALMGAQPYQQQAAGMMGGAAGTAMGATGGYDPRSAKAFMDPYTEEVIQSAEKDARRQAAMLGQEIGASAVGSGAYGGSREAVARSEGARNIADQLSRTTSQLRSQGYQTAQQAAQQAFEAQQGRGLQAAGLVGQLGQGIGGLGAQYGQLGLTGAGQMGQLGLGLGNLGQQQAAMGQLGQQLNIQDISTLGAAGQEQQQYQQALLDAARMNQYQRVMAPYQQAAFRADILSGSPTGVTSTMTQPGPSPLSQIGGIIGALAALGG